MIERTTARTVLFSMDYLRTGLVCSCRDKEICVVPFSYNPNISLLYGIVSTWMPGMATQKTPHPEKKSLEGAVMPDGGYGILGARWVKTTAGGKYRGKERLIHADTKHHAFSGKLRKRKVKHLLFF